MTQGSKSKKRSDEHNEQLRRSEERFRTIYEHAPVMIDSFDARGKCLLWNRECEKNLGWTREEIEASDDPLALAYPDPEVRDRTLKTILRADGKFREYELLAKDGRTRTQMWADFRLPGGDMISVGYDITEQRRAARAIEDNEAKYRLLVAQMPAVLWTTDRDLRFTSSVGSGLAAMNLVPNQVIGMSLFEFFRTDDPEFLPIAIHRKTLEGVPATYETEWAGRVFESHTEPLRNDMGEIEGCIGIALDITQRKKTEEKLIRSEAQLRALTSRLQEVREEESANIAREIHDELGQTLTGLKMDISWVKRRLVEMNGGAVSEVIRRLESMSKEVDETVQTVRRISTQLRPVILDDLGLMRALEWQAGEFERRTNITCDFNVRTKRYNLDPSRSTAVFRIFQEILTNVTRHARAGHVTVDLSCEDNLFVLDVADDGRGISEEELASPRALGLLGMRERAQVCGGDVEIRRRRARGTRVVVKVPVK